MKISEILVPETPFSNQGNICNKVMIVELNENGQGI
jgi:hypothetical protein